jgi:hypothetical protein
LNDWRYRLEEIVSNEGILDDFDDREHPQPAERALNEFITEKLSETGITLLPDELATVARGIKIHDVLEKNEERAQRNSETIESAPPKAVSEADELQAIDDLFARDDLASGD